MKRSLSVWILLGIVFLTILFIFSNSLKNASASKAISGGVIRDLGFVLDRIPLLEDPELREWVVRKGAHLFEFFLLGVAGTTLAVTLRRRFKRSFRMHTLFFSLLIAVFDEYIQSFTGRSSRISDVLIDFCGALLGFAAVLLVQGAICRAKRRRKEESRGEEKTQVLPEEH